MAAGRFMSCAETCEIPVASVKTAEAIQARAFLFTMILLIVFLIGSDAGSTLVFICSLSMSGCRFLSSVSGAKLGVTKLQAMFQCARSKIEAIGNASEAYRSRGNSRQIHDT